MTAPSHLTYGSRRYAPETIASPSVIPLPAGNFARVLHDDEARDDKGQRIRAPEVWPLAFVEYTELTSAWQWFWFRVGLVHPYTGYEHLDDTRLTPAQVDMLEREWRSLTHEAKAFTNNAGTDICKDYISGRNLGADCIPAQGAITCCGNIVKVLGSATAKGIPIETLDGTKPPPPIEKVNRIKTPWLVFCAVNVPGYKRDGKEYPLMVGDRVRADPFPNIADLPGTRSEDTCVPLRSNGRKTGETYTRDGVNYAVNYIRSSRLVKVTGGVVPRVYVP